MDHEAIHEILRRAQIWGAAKAALHIFFRRKNTSYDETEKGGIMETPPLKIRLKLIIAKIFRGHKMEKITARHLGNETFDQWVISYKPKPKS